LKKKSAESNDLLPEKILLRNLGVSERSEIPFSMLEKIKKECSCEDSWALEIDRLGLLGQAQKLALNSWVERAGGNIILHLHSSCRHLNSAKPFSVLSKALTEGNHRVFKVSVIEDDDSSVQTPMELYREVYEEKCMEAYQAIVDDTNIILLCRLFDTQVDEKSIKPV
jgi:DNA polymerase-3 subunit gamma/tau